jgi:hypothetical protein
VYGLGGLGHILACPPANSIMQPRIYTYKITFEEVPYWYWGVHKEKKFGELYLGSPVTHRWMWEVYTPYIQILEFFPHSEEGWREARSIEDRLIMPDLNHPFCLNEARSVDLSIYACSRGGKSTHKEKNKEGKSVRALDLNKRVHAKKTVDGKSVLAVQNAKLLHKEKDAQGKSVNCSKGGKKSNELKNSEGKSLNASKGGKKSREQKNKEGKSINALKPHERKDENGKSLLGLLGAQRLHELKNEEGKSLQGLAAAERLSRKEWKCTITGKVSTAAGLSHWQRARSIDPNNRVKVDNKEDS